MGGGNRGVTGNLGAVRVYLVRHGQSDKNTLPKWRMMTAKQYDKYLCWQIEAPLTSKGAKQVKHTAKWLAEVLPHPSCIYTDTAKRTRETAKAIAKDLDVPVESTPELREVRARGFPPWLPPLQLRLFILLDRFALFIPWPHEGTWYSGIVRARRVLRQVARASTSNGRQTAVVVSHHLFIELMLLYAQFSPAWRVSRRDTTTAGVCVVERQQARCRGSSRCARGPR